MKDEYDDVTPDMFESPSTKKFASKITGKEMHMPSRTYGEEAAQNKPEKPPAKPVRSGGGSSGVLPNDKSGLDRPHLYKKGGKVAGKLATRGYGKAR